MKKLKKLTADFNQFIKFMEDYAIVRGSLKKYFRPWLAWRYRKDLRRLIVYFQIWQCIQEGLEAYSTWRVFLSVYNWPMSYFQRIVSIAGYLGKIRVIRINPYTNQMWLVLHTAAPSIAVEGNEPIKDGKEAHHA